jgi:4-amino-4-deoxy-L-arabinose transferase-like glycosyltransferase
LSGGDASVRAVHLLAALNLSLTALGVTWTGWQLGGRRLGLLAGFFAALSVTNQYLQYNANSEVFLLAPMTFALGACVRGMGTRDLRWIALAGALSALAVLTKSVAILNLLALAGVMAWAAVTDRAIAAFTVRGVAVMLASSVASLGVGVLPWVVSGHWSEFWYANVTYNIAYARETSPLSQFWALFELDGRVIAGGLVVWALGIAGAVRVCSGRVTAAQAAVLASAAAAFAGASSTGREYAHYWAPLLPPAAILAAIALEELTSGWEHLRKRLHAEALLLVLLVPTIVATVQLYLVDVNEAHLVKNRYAAESRDEIASQELAAYIASVSAPDDEVVVFGLEAQLYALANRRPATYFNRPLAALRVDPDTFERTMGELQSEPPKVFVDTARTVISASTTADMSTTASVTDIDPGRRRRIDAFLRDHYGRAKRVAYADVYVLR